MSETTDPAPQPFVLAPPNGGPDRDGAVTVIQRSEKAAFAGDFYQWPGITDNAIPDEFIEKVKSHRAAITPLPQNSPKQNIWTGFNKGDKGFSYGGKQTLPSAELVDPKYLDEELLRKQKITDEAVKKDLKDKFLAVLQRMTEKELSGEGHNDAVMTGDGAVFTWGHGLAYAGGGYMPGAFSDFLLSPYHDTAPGTPYDPSQAKAGQRSEVIKKVFLDHGIAMVDSQLYIMDTDNRKILVHMEAAQYLNGIDSPERKMHLLSVFALLTRRFGVAAATAQWKIVFNNSLVKSKDHILEAIKAGWPTELICYVIHCQLWGKFAGWSAFLALGPDTKKVLRLEVDKTNYYSTVQLSGGKGSYILVPTKNGSVFPAGTMLENMGAKYMLGFLENWETEPEFQNSVQAGDVVFKLNNANGKPGNRYYALRGTHQILDANQELNDWVEDSNGLNMKDFLKAVVERSQINKLTRTRDYYISAANPKQLEWGVRPLIAMNAELNKKNFNKCIEAMALCPQAGITLAGTPDQYFALLKHMGLDKYDAWVEKHHAMPLSYLLDALKKRTYAENKNNREWYASNANQRKEFMGVRPLVAMDAILHKDEGESARWILNQCPAAGITQQSTPDQLDLIKQTIGVT